MMRYIVRKLPEEKIVVMSWYDWVVVRIADFFLNNFIDDKENILSNWIAGLWVKRVFNAEEE